MNRNLDLPGDGLHSAARVVAALPLMSRIDLKEQTSMRYWCRMLGATPLEICRAVASVGPDPAAVRGHLRRCKDPDALRMRRARRAAPTASRSNRLPAALAILGMHRRTRSFPPHGFVS